MKRILSLILTVTMIASMMLSTTINVAAATGDSTLDFEGATEFTQSGTVPNTRYSVYSEDNYSISGRISHQSQVMLLNQVFTVKTVMFLLQNKVLQNMMQHKWHQQTLHRLFH